MLKLRTLACGAALLGSLAGIAYTAAAIARVRAFRRRPVPDSREQPPITILKPLHGSEPHLYENLRSLCSQTYPRFQVIFCAARSDDPALEIAARLQREFPACDIEIAGGHAKPAPNPKIGNLLGGIDRAKYGIIAIADSDISAGPGYLHALAAGFEDERTGAVTCLYGGLAQGTVASQLGAMHVNEVFAPSALVAQALEPLSYCFGATMAVRREVLEAGGGLQSLAEHLGDDYVLGQIVTHAGYRVELSPFAVRTDVTDATIRELWVHELRWARTIRAARPAGYAGSIVTYPLVWSLLFALLSGTPIAWVVVAIAAALRVALHAEGRKTFAPENRPAPWLVPVREALGVAVWAAAFLGGSVRWRGADYGLEATGRMAPDPKEL